MKKPVSQMTLQQMRDAIVEAQQAGNWKRVAELRTRIIYTRKVQASKNREPPRQPINKL